MADLDMEIVTEIEGLDELEAALLIGGPKAAKAFLRRVEKKAAVVLQNAAKANAPVMDGELEDDINVQIVTDAGGMTARVGPSQQTWYGLVQEIGAPSENVPALHWLEMAARGVQTEVQEEYINAVTESLNEMKG